MDDFAEIESETREDPKATRATLMIEPTARGWKIVGERHESLAPRSRRDATYASVEEAREAAIAEGEHAPEAEQVPCELIIHDVYHRVVRRELIELREVRRADRQRRGTELTSKGVEQRRIPPYA
jgi:hypothetical protein